MSDKLSEMIHALRIGEGECLSFVYREEGPCVRFTWEQSTARWLERFYTGATLEECVEKALSESGRTEEEVES